MPGCTYAVELAERRHLARRGDAADLADMRPNEVDQPFCDQRNPFTLIIEELAHRDRGSGLVAQDAEPLGLLGRQRIFEKEELVGLYGFLGLHRLGRLEAFVNIMQQLDVEAHYTPHVLQHWRY